MKKYCSRCNVRLINLNEKICSVCQSKNDNRHKEYKKYRTDVKEQQFYNSKEWKIVRERIRNRDNGYCLVCQSEKSLRFMDTVHHIEELKENWSTRFDEENLISVCESCHQHIHNQYKINKYDEQERLSCILRSLRSK